MEEQFRPEADSRKIHSKDEFELCYLRHQYFRKTKANPHPEEMAPYRRIIKNQANNTWFTYKNLFLSVGFEVDDLISVGQVQLVSFLGLFAVESSAEKLHDFKVSFLKKNGDEPLARDILGRNKALFTLFLKQRMEDVVRICRQKARNIKGTITDEFHVFYGPRKPGKDLTELDKHYPELGYKKLDMAAFRTIRKRSGERNGVFKYNGNWYICIPIKHKVLSLEDLDGANLNPHDGLHNKNPEEIFMQIEENQAFEEKRQDFEQSSDEDRAAVLRAFLSKNRRNPALAAELETARKMLLALEK